jgi:hypothetical protein
VTAPKRPIDHLLDLCVFVPAGVVASVRELVPEMASKGREKLEVQVRVAQMVGELFVARGRREAAKAVGRLRPTAPAATPPSPDPEPTAADEDEVIPVRLEDPDPVPAASGGADELAIPGYDSLAASQVVPRLDGLTTDELEAVRRYELAHRGRQTVLGKVAQLQER